MRSTHQIPCRKWLASRRESVLTAAGHCVSLGCGEQVVRRNQTEDLAYHWWGCARVRIWWCPGVQLLVVSLLHWPCFPIAVNVATVLPLLFVVVLGGGRSLVGVHPVRVCVGPSSLLCVVSCVFRFRW